MRPRRPRRRPSSRPVAKSMQIGAKRLPPSRFFLVTDDTSRTSNYSTKIPPSGNGCATIALFSNSVAEMPGREQDIYLAVIPHRPTSQLFSLFQGKCHVDEKIRGERDRARILRNAASISTIQRRSHRSGPRRLKSPRSPRKSVNNLYEIISYPEESRIVWKKVRIRHGRKKIEHRSTRLLDIVRYVHVRLTERKRKLKIYYRFRDFRRYGNNSPIWRYPRRR